MSKWIDFSLDERKAMIQGVVEAQQIDEAAAEKDWWVTAVLYAPSVQLGLSWKRPSFCVKSSKKTNRGRIE